MPEQTALAELLLSSDFRQCQRALSQWLGQDARPSALTPGPQAPLLGLCAREQAALRRWLAILAEAAQANGQTDQEGRVRQLLQHCQNAFHGRPPGAARAAAGMRTLTGLRATDHGAGRANLRTLG